MKLGTLAVFHTEHPFLELFWAKCKQLVATTAKNHNFRGPSYIS